MSKLNKLKLASLAVAGLGAVAAGNVMAASMTVDSNGGIEVFELDDHKYWFKLGGRLHLDSVWYTGSDSDRSRFPSGARIRSARVSLKGGVGHNWVYKIDFDHSDSATTSSGNSGSTRIGEAFIAYEGCKNIWIALGQVSTPFSLEGWTSANETPFMEAAMPIQAFSPPYGIGVYAEWNNDYFTVAGTLTRPGAGSRQTGDVLSADATVVPGAGPFGSFPGSEPLAIAGRATFSPIHDDYTVYHFGVSYRYQELHDHANYHQFVALPEVRSRQAPELFTNIPPNSVKNYDVLGLELAGRWGSWMAAAEYVHSNVDRDSSYPVNDPRNPGGDLNLHGYSVMASWIITGEVKDYEFTNGSFGRVHPKSQSGAWEVAARHSYVRLQDIAEFSVLPIPFTTPNAAAPGALAMGPFGILSGNQNFHSIGVHSMLGNVHSTTLGLTWWLNDHVRFLANYVRASYPGDVDMNGFGLRAQVNF